MNYDSMSKWGTKQNEIRTDVLDILDTIIPDISAPTG